MAVRFDTATSSRFDVVGDDEGLSGLGVAGGLRGCGVGDEIGGVGSMDGENDKGGSE